MKIVEKQDPFNDEINKEIEELQRRSQELSNVLDSKKLTLKPKKNIQ